MWGDENPAVFGGVAQKDLFTYEVRLSKQPARLTKGERVKAKRCVKAGSIGKCDYANIDRGETLRRPMESCQYGTIRPL